MPKGQYVRKPRTEAAKSSKTTNKSDARLTAVENKVELLLKGLHAGHLAAAKALPKQRPGRQPRATA